MKHWPQTGILAGTADDNEGNAMTYCWDCEIATNDSALCRSCERHRAECGAPNFHEDAFHAEDHGRTGVIYRTSGNHGRGVDWLKVGGAYYRHGVRGEPANPWPVVTAWYCHGAGPSGVNTSRLRQVPRPLTALEVGAGIYQAQEVG